MARILVWTVLALLSVFGCSAASVTEQARLLGTQAFSQAGWQAATQEQRGAMVYSFLAQHDVKSLSSSEIKNLLGKPTGYYDYDEYPAYFIGPASVASSYGNGYLLAFVADKESGRIKASHCTQVRCSL